MSSEPASAHVIFCFQWVAVSSIPVARLQWQGGQVEEPHEPQSEPQVAQESDQEALVQDQDQDERGMRWPNFSKSCPGVNVVITIFGEIDKLLATFLQ
jgi:hypothetical protein